MMGRNFFFFSYPIVLGTVGAPLCGESWAMSHGNYCNPKRKLHYRNGLNILQIVMQYLTNYALHFCAAVCWLLQSINQSNFYSANIPLQSQAQWRNSRISVQQHYCGEQQSYAWQKCSSALVPMTIPYQNVVRTLP